MSSNDHQEETQAAMEEANRLIRFNTTFQAVCDCDKDNAHEILPIPGSKDVRIGWSHRPGCPEYEKQEVKPR